MDEKRYWSVRDACWLPSPRPLSALETPWSLHARSSPQPSACPTPEQDLRWLRLPPVCRPGLLLPAQRRDHQDARSAQAGAGEQGPATAAAARPVAGGPARRT